MKVFISQPMRCKKPQTILEERKKLIEKAREEFGADVEIIDSYFGDVSHSKRKPLWWLGRSIQLLSEADAVIFAKDWFIARGCRLEYMCAKTYDIKTLELKYDE